MRSVAPPVASPSSDRARHKQIDFDATHVFSRPQVRTILSHGVVIWITHSSNGLHGVPMRGLGASQNNRLALQFQYPFAHVQLVSA